jgi:hypothetical protein
MIWEIIRSGPVEMSVVCGFGAFHSCFPMFISQIVSHCVHFCSGAEETAIVGFGFDVVDGDE